MSELEKLAHAVLTLQHTVIELVGMQSAMRFALIQAGVVTEERLEMIRKEAEKIARRRAAEKNN